MVFLIYKFEGFCWQGFSEEFGRDFVFYLYVQVFARGGRCIGIGVDGGVGVDVISVEVVYGVVDFVVDGVVVILVVKINIF